MVLKSTTKTKLLLSTLMALTVGVGVVNQHESVVRAEDSEYLEVFKYDGVKLGDSNSYGSYSKNDFTYNSTKFTITGTCGSNQSSGFYFGVNKETNKGKASLKGTNLENAIKSSNSKIDIENNAAALIFDYSFENISKISVSWSKAQTDMNLHLLYSNEENSYSLIKTTTISTTDASSYDFEFNKIDSAKYAIAITKIPDVTGYIQLQVPKVTFYQNSTKLSLSADKENLYVSDATQITANVENANVSDIEWSQSSEDEGKLEIQKNEQGAMVTATHAGNVLVTAKIGSVSATQNIIIKERPYVEVENATHDLGLNDNTTVKIYLRNADFDLSTIQKKDIVFTENDKVVSTEYIGYSADEQCFSYKITALQEGQVTLSLSINYGDYNFEFSFDGEPEQNPLFFNVTNATHYTVQFKYQNELIESVLVEQGSLLTSHPTNPEPKGEDEGKIFDGWYRENGNIWNFEEDKVTEDNLVLNAKFRDKTAEEKVADLETKANLGFSYSIENTTENKNVSLATNSNVNSNWKSVEGEGKEYFDITVNNEDLSDLISSIYFDKNNASNSAYVGGNNKEIRLYSNGGSVTISSPYVINSLTITVAAGTCTLIVGETSKAISTGNVSINSTKFTLKNNGTARVDLRSFSLNIATKSTTSSFSNVRARFTAHISDDIYSELDIVRVGVKVTLEGQEEELDIQIEKSKISIGSNEHYFTGSVTQIPLQACKLKMTAQAYIVVNGEKTIMLQAKTMSVDDMVNYYLSNLDDLGLQDQADVLKAFQASYANEEI